MAFFGHDEAPPPFWGHEDVPKIDVETAVHAVDDGALLIDLGEPKDWMAGHLPNARLVEPELFDMELKTIPREQRIIVAGRNAPLTEEIVAAIRERGYDAAMLDGGPSAWQASGRALVRPAT